MRTQEVFKAISDPTRRKVLKLLQRGSKTAGDLGAADLVRCERRGQQIVYSLNTTVFEDVAAMLLDLFRVDGRKGEQR
jgi:ArsR family transcriptional regulator